MGLKVAVAAVAGGPDGNSAWTGVTHGQRVAAQSITTSAPGSVCIGVVPQPDTVLSSGQSNPEAFAPIPSGGKAIQRLVGAQVAVDATLIAETTLNFNLSVYRAGVQVGGTWAYGWSTVIAGTPAFATAFGNTAMPANPLNTAFSSNLASGIGLQPGDVIVLSATTSSSTVAWPGSCTTLQIT